jgi:hypothetical protein
MENIQQHIDNLLNSDLGKSKDSNIHNIANRKKIYQFDETGKLICEYDSIKTWQKKFEHSVKSITLSYKCKGYYFSFDIEFKPPTKNNRRIKGEPVQLIKDGIVMYEFDTVKQAQDFLQVNRSTINDAVNGRQKTCKGYIVKKK